MTSDARRWDHQTGAYEVPPYDPADATAAHRAYLDAAGWDLTRDGWRDPDAPRWPAFADTPAGVARAAFVERERWATR